MLRLTALLLTETFLLAQIISIFSGITPSSLGKDVLFIGLYVIGMIGVFAFLRGLGNGE